MEKIREATRRIRWTYGGLAGIPYRLSDKDRAWACWAGAAMVVLSFLAALLGS